MTKKQFNQSKFEYYRKMNMWVVVAATFSSIGYFFSDCYLFGRMTVATLLPRMSILLPFVVFMIVNRYTKDYRVMVPLSYVAAHCVMWCTIWACTYLPDLSFACDGFIIIHFIFLALGIVAPCSYGVIAHALLFVDIMIANTFLDYPSYDMMFLLGVPLYFGISIFDIAIERTYRDQLKMKLQLEDNLKHDRLTGAYNRTILSPSFGETIVKGQTMLAMYDLDHFKHINDTFGHIYGDEVLVRVTQTVQSQLQEDEYLIRWGGEEFVIILNGLYGAFEERAQRIRRAVEELDFANGAVTISLGLADCDGSDIQQIIKNADTALYQAKNGGRNCVELYRAE